MSKIRLTLSDPIKAQEQAFEMMSQFKLATYKDKHKIKFALAIAIKNCRAANQTYIASVYISALQFIDKEPFLRTH